MEKRKRQRRQPGRPIHFEWQPFCGYRIVALDCKLSDFKGVAAIENGVPVMKYPEKTVKDCRNIDGCVYYMLGRVDESYMIELIENFQKVLKEKGAWKPQKGIEI